MNEPAKTLPLSETFLSMQGEGPYAGRLSHFVRLGGCNLSCGYGGGFACDSGYTWDARTYNLRKELAPLTAAAIAATVDEECTDVIITGGEPLIHQTNPAWDELLRRLARSGKRIAVETNGTVAPTATTATFVDHFTISPKFNTTHKRGQNPDLAQWPQHYRHARACLKFVCADVGAVQEAVRYSDWLGWPRDNVWVMPEGVEATRLNEVFAVIAPEAIAQRINVCHRLHVLAFGNTRGT